MMIDDLEAYAIDLAVAKAEIDRLRAALPEIIDEDYGLQSPHQKRMADLAREAIKQ